MSEFLVNLLGERLVNSEKAEVDVQALGGKLSLVGLYFGCSQNAPCKQFNASLCEFYGKFKKSSEHKDKLEIVFISSDQDQKHWQDFLQEMQWPALPFKDRHKKMRLWNKYKVTSVPSLVFVDAATGKVVCRNGLLVVRDDPKGLEFPWGAKPFAEVVAGPLLRNTRQTADSGSLEGHYVGVYFSAHWVMSQSCIMSPLSGATPGGGTAVHHAKAPRPTAAGSLDCSQPIASRARTRQTTLMGSHSVLSESSLATEGEAISQDAPGLPGRAAFPGPAQGSRGRTVVTVPGAMLKNVRRYREDFDGYLRLVAHEPVGSFNPWAIADSLAEQLLEEALAGVAAEFQDACEDYAEAVFTSEFLQPVQSPPAPVPPPPAPPLGLA
ncbi:unnamed protein product [Lota lota]